MNRFFKRLLKKRNNKTCQDDDYMLRAFPTVITSGTSENELLEKPQIAIQVHIYFVELMDEMLEAVNNIIYPFDCYISTDTVEKKEIIEKQFVPFCNAKNIIVENIENRGRDVAPFLCQIKPVIKKYKYIGHIHTKRSLHTDFGEDWRKYLLRHLMGSPEYVKGVFNLFEANPDLGFIMPDVYPVIKEYVKWDGAKDSVKEIINKIGLDIDLPNEPIFPTGNMFWARCEAIEPLFKVGYTMKDLPNEEGQLNLTLAHSIERLWIYLMKAQGYSYRICVNKITKNDKKSRSSYNRLFVYSGSGMEKQLEEYGKVYRHSYENLSIDILKEYSQIVFVDESCLGPIDDLENIFEIMDSQEVDMWSMLAKPIYFLVLNKKILESSIWERDWKLEKKPEGLCQYLYANLMKEGYSFKTFIHESEYIDQWVHTDSPQNELPYEFLLLGDPFIKKDAVDSLESMEKERLKSFLMQLPNEERITELYEKFI